MALFAMVLSGMLAACQSPSAASPLPTTVISPTEAPPAATASQPQAIAGGPELLFPSLSIRRIVEVGGGNIRLDRHPVTNDLYLLSPGTGLSRVDVDGSTAPTVVATPSDMVGDATLAGMAFGPDGTLYVVANRRPSQVNTQAIVSKGTAAADGTWSWQTIMRTKPYPVSDTAFDHLFNGIVVSPDGAFLFLNSGSRTDHGEVENNQGNAPNLREIPLTSAIFRIPADATDLTLPADETELQSYLYADGTRNAYDLAFAPNGDLFAIDNGPDADYPEELNWIQEGAHYGFPWRFGNDDNPQQFAGYDSSKDKLLSQDFTAVRSGTYRDDPEFPPAPEKMTAPIANLGPDAAIYRASDGSEQNAAATNQPLYSFTPHRSPLGLVFVPTELLPNDLSSTADLHAMVLSWGAAGGKLSDKGEDILLLALTKKGDVYEMTTTQIAKGFKNPIDAVLIGQKLYILEYGPNGAIWELSFNA